jgi:hypothetical protein
MGDQQEFLFRNAFYLLSAMFIGDDWMVDLVIIYIEKTVAKALDINDIINKNYGVV